MNKETNPTEDYLKAVSGKFDLETIFTLELPLRNISKIGSIPDCCSLILLNLSRNKISNINALSKLDKLNFLDLSFNQIYNMDGLENLLLLRHLKLHGNNISKTPNRISQLTRLEKLTFQIMPLKGEKTNTSNPICQDGNYRQNILDSLPNLKMLDGFTRDMEPFSLDDGEDINNKLDEKLNPDNFDFDFAGKVKFDKEEVITQADIDNAKKTIDDKYNEFKKGIDDLKAMLNNMK